VEEASGARIRRRTVGTCGGVWLALIAGVALAQGIPAATPSSGGVTPGAGGSEQVGGTVPQASQTVVLQEMGTTGVDALAAAGAQPGLKTTLWQMQGLMVDKIVFEGVTFEANATLPAELPQKAGQPLDPIKVRESTRRLFASGRYRDIAVRGVRHGSSVTLIFAGTARYFVGRISIQGVSSDRLSSLLEFSTKLDPGTSYVPSALPAATANIKQTLEQNGYYEPEIALKTNRDEVGRQINVTYVVATGPQAKVGDVRIEGTDPGLTEKDFRKKGKLKRNSRVGRDTTSNALSNLRAVYQKNDRLEGTVTLEKQSYDPAKDSLNYQFRANQGPIVKVLTEGIKVSKSRLHLLVPIFEEGTVDNDLLNEGSHNIKDFLQQQGYFDAAVQVKVLGEDTPSERVLYTADKGKKHKVYAVDFKGNKYFSDDILRERVRVQRADAYLRSGRYSQALVTSDVGSIEALYRANGFNAVKVTTAVKDVDIDEKGKPLKVAAIRVTYTIEEGPQQRFGAVQMAGVDAAREADVRGLLNTQSGQPFSLITLTGDRDAVLSYYLARGFDQAKVEVKQTVEGEDKTRTDVTLNVTEGPEVFTDKVLVSGVHRTKPRIVDDQILMHSGQPLDQSALLDTQRRLYNLALFNEVVAAVQNPTGAVPQKNVLVQVTEAKRWDVTYGFGFEAQTGTPTRGSISQASLIQLGLPPNQQLSQSGKAGVSPRVSLDISRINLFGTEKSLTLHTAYGLLETIALLSFQNPNLLGSPNLSAQVSGGYSNVQNITTFAASTLQGDFRVTQRVPKTDTFIYDFQYRRVKVDPNSLQVSANLIPQLSQPVRVGGPGVTWLHDRRSPSPLDATKGWYMSVQEFLASSKFGSQTDFNRLDMTNSTYTPFGKRKYVFARNTRFGFENVFGQNPNVGNQECLGDLLTTNASCSAVPLPERLYAGGASSHRGFPINGAGPRDLQTGFPVGGTSAFVNTFELRLPAPTLPVVGSSVNFVVFHDMGNVFTHVGDTFSSFLHFRQPNQDTCKDVSGSIGRCNFNYFSHAVGLGARYNTPVGPIRADFSYNLNPPIYPVIYDFNNNPPYVGQASHFNFFFSIGQSF
jgi:outer membrane protein insertion porin family